MKRRDELLVGATIFFALAVVAAGALWLSQTRLGAANQVFVARFQTVGGLGVGDPVVMRGVRVGRVRSIQLGARNWVEAELELYEMTNLPERPAILAASASLFGEWQASIIDLDQPPEDPNVLRELRAAAAQGDDAWPGATLPDIGQLTAQANRIATDITTISSRVQSVLDTQAVRDLQASIRNFRATIQEINRFTDEQTDLLGDVTGNLREGSGRITEATRLLHNALARVDSATNQGELDVILDRAAASSIELNAAVSDFRDLVGVIHANQASLVRVLQGADSLMARLQTGRGTMGMLFSDSALYEEAVLAVSQLRRLIADIQENPRKYFKFSVF